MFRNFLLTHHTGGMAIRIHRGVPSMAGWILILFITTAIMAGRLTSALASPGIEIEGLVLDETQTHVGRQFYEYFSTFWIEPRDIQNYTIKVGERASAQWGDWVWVLVTVGPFQDHMVFKSLIKPNTTDVEEKSLIAVRRALGFIERYKLLKGKIKEEDLKGDGF